VSQHIRVFRCGSFFRWPPLSICIFTVAGFRPGLATSVITAPHCLRGSELSGRIQSTLLITHALYLASEKDESQVMAFFPLNTFGSFDVYWLPTASWTIALVK
jgi:hypothetical protein